MASESDSVSLVETRIKLIGNKDFKYLLVCNSEYVLSLVYDLAALDTSLKASLDLIDADSPLIAKVSDGVVILKILCCFASTLGKTADSTAFLEILDGVPQPLLGILQSVNTLMLAAKPSGNIAMFQDVACDILDLMLNMSNLKTFAFDQSALYCYITQAVGNSSVSNAIAIRLLRLVPMILSHGLGDCQLWVALLTTMLTRAFSMAREIIMAHWPQLMKDTEEMVRLVLDQNSLPGLSLNWEITERVVDMNLLRELILRVAQAVALVEKRGLRVEISDKINGSCLPMRLLHFHFILLMLLKDDYDLKLRVITLNLIVLCLEHSIPCLTTMRESGEYQRFFPVIVSMLDLDGNSTAASEVALVPMFLKSPTRILSEFCDNYSHFLLQITSLNLCPKLVNKLGRMSATCRLNQVVLKLKQESHGGSRLMDFEVLLGVPRDDGPVADLLHLLGVYTLNFETHRSRVVACKKTESHGITLSQLLFEVIENYHFMQTQIVLAHDAITDPKGPKIAPCDWSWLQSSVHIMLKVVDSALPTSALTLLRLLLRSIAQLRTFFVLCDEKVAFYACNSPVNDDAGLVSTLVRTIGTSKPLEEAKFYWRSMLWPPATIDDGQDRTLTFAIAITANLIVDSSSFREQISSHPEFMPAIISLYQNCPIKSEGENTSDPNRLVELESVRLSIMNVIANYMFNETTPAKLDFIDQFPIVDILAKTSYGLDAQQLAHDEGSAMLTIRIKQKLKGFDILRNLTAGLPEIYYKVTEAYTSLQRASPQLPLKWHHFLVESITNFSLFSTRPGTLDDDDYMVEMFQSLQYTRLVESINYIENHRYTLHQSIQPEHFPAPELLEVWLRLLKLQPSGSKLCKCTDLEARRLISDMNTIKVGIVWILINLTWRYASGDGFDEKMHDNEDDDAQLPDIDMLDSDLETHSADASMHEHAEGNNNNSMQLEGESSEAQQADMLAQKRIDELNLYGFGEVVEELVQSYQELITRGPKYGVPRGMFRMDVANSHDLAEMLCTALRQLSGKAGELLQREMAAPKAGPWLATEEAAHSTSPADATDERDFELQVEREAERDPARAMRMHPHASDRERRAIDDFLSRPSRTDATDESASRVTELQPRDEALRMRLEEARLMALENERVPYVSRERVEALYRQTAERVHQEAAALREQPRLTSEEQALSGLHQLLDFMELAGFLMQGQYRPGGHAEGHEERRSGTGRAPLSQPRYSQQDMEQLYARRDRWEQRVAEVQHQMYGAQESPPLRNDVAEDVLDPDRGQGDGRGEENRESWRAQERLVELVRGYRAEAQNAAFRQRQVEFGSVSPRRQRGARSDRVVAGPDNVSAPLSFALGIDSEDSD